VLGRNCEDCNKGELEENLLKKGRQRAAKPLSAAEPVERRPGLGSSHYAAIPAAVPCEAGSWFGLRLFPCLAQTRPLRALAGGRGDHASGKGELRLAFAPVRALRVR
jgi:hypothetical protein